MNFLESLFPESDSEEWVFVDKKARRRFVFGYRALRDGENRIITLDCDDAHHTFFDRMTVTPHGILLHRFNLLTETVDIASPGWLLTESQKDTGVVNNILPPDRQYFYGCGPFVGRILANYRYEAYLAGQEHPAEFWRVVLSIDGQGGTPVTASFYFKVGAGLIRYSGRFDTVTFDYRRQPESLWKHSKESERLHKPEPTALDKNIEIARNTLSQLHKDIERLGEALAQPVTPFTQEAAIRRFERAWDGWSFGILAIAQLELPEKEMARYSWQRLAEEKGWPVDPARWNSMAVDRGKGQHAHETYLVDKLFRKIVWHHSTLMDSHTILVGELLKWDSEYSDSRAATKELRTSFAFFREEVHRVMWNIKSGETVLCLRWEKEDRPVGKADSMTAAVDLAMAWMIKNLDG